MKKILIATTALLVLAPTAAVAGESTDMLQAEIERLVDTVARLNDKVEHKNDVIACERENRRKLERALREGGAVLTVRC
jgi:tetrahydromethanopterin S-methyltransferase subunit B